MSVALQLFVNQGATAVQQQRQTGERAWADVGISNSCNDDAMQEG